MNAPIEDERMLLAYLRERDVACPLCGYNVRNLTTPRCPECGRELKLTIGIAEPWLSAWIALVIVLCASGGLGLFCILMTIKSGFPNWGGRYKAALDITFIFHMAMTPVAIAVILARRWLLRLDKRHQWILFGVAASICAVMFGVFITFVR